MDPCATVLRANVDRLSVRVYPLLAPRQNTTLHFKRIRDAAFLPEKSEELSANLPETVQHMIPMKKTEETAVDGQFILSYPGLAVVFQRFILIKTFSPRQPDPSHCRKIPVAPIAVTDHS